MLTLNKHNYEAYHPDIWEISWEQFIAACNEAGVTTERIDDWDVVFSIRHEILRVASGFAIDFEPAEYTFEELVAEQVGPTNNIVYADIPMLLADLVCRKIIPVGDYVII